jgi:hypothetical protein
MSRGLGRLERYILERMEAAQMPDQGGTTRPVTGQATMLARDYYQPEDWGWGLYEPSNAQRKAMIRALHSFVRKFPQYALMGGTGRKTLLLYEPADPISTAWATAMLTRSFCSYSEARDLARDTR